MAELPVDVGIGAVQLVGKVFQVSGNIPASLVVLHIVMVEVPVELGLAFFLEEGEELLLDFLQQVETHEEIAVVGEMLGNVCCHGMTTYLPVKRTFIGQPLFGQPLVEVVIDVRKVAP